MASIEFGISKGSTLWENWAFDSSKIEKKSRILLSEWPGHLARIISDVGSSDWGHRFSNPVGGFQKDEEQIEMSQGCLHLSHNSSSFFVIFSPGIAPLTP